jgi:GT2 family glycosyltransferase
VEGEAAGLGAGAAPVVVAVVSWNTRELLRRCLGSLADSAASGLAAVWVIDNGSADGSAEMVRREFPWASLMVAESNLGYGRAVNAVAGRTRSTWIVAANADVELAPGALESMLAAASDRPLVGAVAPRLERDGAAERSVHRFPTLANTALAWAGFERRLDLTRAGVVDWAHGALLLIRRAAFDQVGGFDPNHWLFVEDVDLCWRLAGAGWAVRYEPSAEVVHAGAAATSQARLDRPAREVEALYGWMARRRGWRVTRAFALLNLAALAARVPLFALLAVFGGQRRRAKSAAASRQVRHHLAGLRSRSAILGYR